MAHFLSSLSSLARPLRTLHDEQPVPSLQPEREQRRIPSTTEPSATSATAAMGASPSSAAGLAATDDAVEPALRPTAAATSASGKMGATILAGLRPEDSETRCHQAKVRPYLSWSRQTKEEAVAERRRNGLALGRWNDLIFAILFIAQFAGFVVLSVIAIKNLSASNSSGGLGSSGGTAITLNRCVRIALRALASASGVELIIV